MDQRVVSNEAIEHSPKTAYYLATSKDVVHREVSFLADIANQVAKAVIDSSEPVFLYRCYDPSIKERGHSYIKVSRKQVDVSGAVSKEDELILLQQFICRAILNRAQDSKKSQ